MASSEPPRFLLLLPPVSPSAPYDEVRTAFVENLRQVLNEVAAHSSETPGAAVLEIALACPHLSSKNKSPRSKLYSETEVLVANIYKLICTVAAKENINVEDNDGVDVRILLIAWKADPDANLPAVTDEFAYGPVVSLETLAKSGRPWQFVFGAESEPGEAMMKAFLTAKNSQEEAGPVQGRPPGHASTGITAKSQPQDSTNPQHSDKLHRHVIVGGTFDHIHIGHKLLLTMTIFMVDCFPSGERSATVGITSDQMLKDKKHAEVLESWEDRQRSVATFINALVDFAPPAASGHRHVSVRDDPGPNGKSLDIHYPDGLVVKCTEIQDPFGPTITEERLTALLISAETRSGGKAVNEKRSEKGWRLLETFEVGVLDADEVGSNTPVKTGFERKLSSTAIREKLTKKKQSSL